MDEQKEDKALTAYGIAKIFLNETISGNTDYEGLTSEIEAYARQENKIVLDGLKIYQDMFEGIKNPIDWMASSKIMHKHGQVFKIVEGIFKFIEEVHTKQKPMVTEIVIDVKDENKPISMVSLWAGVGEQNPLARLKFLRTHADSLADMLKRHIRYRESGNPDDLEALIEYSHKILEAYNETK